MFFAQTFPGPSGEVVPPANPPQDYAAPSRPRRREYSVWDPRSAPGTYLLLASNIAVYLWMVLHHVSAMDPSEGALVHYGANVTWLVLHGQWYRLLTATFVHIGLLHIATNMWCLWNLGILGEPLIGPFGMVAVYFITGIAGNLLSMATDVAYFQISRDPRALVQVGAGASGAVFGIAGILIVLLSNRKLPFPWFELRRLRSSVVKFALINLVIGLSTMVVNVGIRIDNAGRDGYLARQKIAFALACLLLALFGYFIARMA
jgi:rhomboid protease GluP